MLNTVHGSRGFVKNANKEMLGDRLVVSVEGGRDLLFLLLAAEIKIEGV